MTKRVITFHYTLTDPSGEVIDSSQGHEPLSFIEGEDQIIPGLEATVITLAAGDKQVIHVEAAQAYGPRDDEHVVTVPRSEMPMQEIGIGDQFQTDDTAGSPVWTVAEVTDTHVILDANHPLAGLDLTFDVELVEMRDATAEELAHGHVHGAGGHHH